MIAIDPTVETVCGNQEGAEVGYNPSKQGRRATSAALDWMRRKLRKYKMEEVLAAADVGNIEL